MFPFFFEAFEPTDQKMLNNNNYYQNLFNFCLLQHKQCRWNKRKNREILPQLHAILTESEYCKFFAILTTQITKLMAPAQAKKEVFFFTNTTHIEEAQWMEWKRNDGLISRIFYKLSNIIKQSSFPFWSLVFMQIQDTPSLLQNYYGSDCNGVRVGESQPNSGR